jgi:FHA domain
VYITFVVSYVVSSEMPKNISLQIVCCHGSHSPIELPDGKAVSIGRSAVMNISDSRVSRTQGTKVIT